MKRFFLITEPARGTSIMVNVPDGTLLMPAEALEFWAAQTERFRPVWLKWRTESEMVGFIEYLTDALDGDEIVFHEVTFETTVAPGKETAGTLFDRWVATRKPCADLGAELAMPDLNGVTGFTYDGGYIEDGGVAARFHLLIQHDEWWSDDLAELEARLFWVWVHPEGYDAAVRP